MTITCKYCNEPENKQGRPGLVCDTCMNFVHLGCLWRPGTPGDLACDIFFDFTCADCSKNTKEVFKRNKFPWVNVIYLALYHLNVHSYGISNRGFFHYKTHICSFIDRYWSVLFGNNSKQKKNWIGTIAGALSVYSNMFFRSGSVQLGESGWWRLQHLFSPAVAAHILQEIAKDKRKGQRRNALVMDREMFFAKVADLGYKFYLVIDDIDVPLSGVEPAAAKKRRLESDVSGVSNNSGLDQFDSDTRYSHPDDSMMDEKSNDLSSLPFKNTSYMDEHVTYSSLDYFGAVPPSESSSHTSYQNYNLHYESDSRSARSASPIDHPHNEVNLDKKMYIKPKITETPKYFKTESLFSTQLNSLEMPWDTKIETPKDVVLMSAYEEVQLLKKVEGLIPKMKDGNKKAELRRLKAKLALRRLKRHKHLTVFDLDRTVKVLGGYFAGDHEEQSNAERVLDRFQRTFQMANLCGTISSTNYGTLLLSRIEPVSFQSPYSGAILKPYIRRDTESQPLFLKLMDELLFKSNRKNPDYKLPPRSSIDYSYVRPQHLPAINNMCAQYFWPGIDVTEALQYPEFSCVVTYKKLVVAFAFLVPDVGRNETYISFLFTRPEWRNAKLATFMLYHLLQTCTGKDVTLHVSPTNPAIFLYQKFGFKVEELVQDFYEKYFDIDYKGCRHALFLRLVR